MNDTARNPKADKAGPNKGMAASTASKKLVSMHDWSPLTCSGRDGVMSKLDCSADVHLTAPLGLC